MPDATSDPFHLVVPSDPRHISTARIFAAAVARVAGADEDTVEDVKVGISEACSMTLRKPHGSDPLEVSIVAEPERLRFQVTGELPPVAPESDAADAPTPTPTGIAATLGREVVSALFEDTEITGEGGRGSIRFSTPFR